MTNLQLLKQLLETLNEVESKLEQNEDQFNTAKIDIITIAANTLEINLKDIITD